tara:strand:- start:301 stop:4020 length:3720 start_codon:yes stop_codon:yes gene_type:complete
MVGQIAGKRVADTLVKTLLKNIKPKFSVPHETADSILTVLPRFSSQSVSTYGRENSPKAQEVLDLEKNLKVSPFGYSNLREWVTTVKPKLENLREKEGNKYIPSLNTTQSSSPLTQDLSSGAVFANHLVNKKTFKLPTTEPKTAAETYEQMKLVQNQIDNADASFQNMFQALRGLSDSQFQNIPSANFILNQNNWKIPNAKKVFELTSNAGGFHQFPNRGYYDYPEYNDEIVTALTNFDAGWKKMGSLIKKMTNQSPAYQTPDGNYVGKLSADQKKQIEKENFVYYLNQDFKGKEHLDLVPDNIINKHMDKIITKIFKKNNPLNPKEWQYQVNFYKDPRKFDTKRGNKDPISIKSAEFHTNVGGERTFKETFNIPKNQAELLTPSKEKAGLIQLASRLGQLRAEQDIISNFVRGQMYERGLPDVSKLMASGDPKFKKLILDKMDEQLPAMKDQLTYEAEIKKDKEIAGGLKDLMMKIYPDTDPSRIQTFNRGHKFAQAKVGQLYNALPDGAAKESVKELLRMSGDVNMIQFQPSIVNKPITSAVEQVLQNPNSTLSATDKSKLQALLQKLKTTSIFIDMQGRRTPYGAMRGDPYAINRLTKKEFLELIDILNKDNYRDIGRYIRAGQFDKFNRGGAVDYGEMKDVVPPLDPGERQHLNPGGIAGQAGSKIATQYIKKQILPKVIGHTTKIMEKLAAPKDAPEIKPFAVVDREGLPIKDFKTQKEAEKWLYDKKETVPENEYYESTIDYSVKPISEIKTQTAVEDTPAMMWKTPSVIADAPMNVAQGKQWLGILKKAGVSPKELEDTSMGPFLNNLEPNSKFTKQELLNEFDELVPKISVIATGKRDQGKYVKNITDKFNAIRDRIDTFDGKDQQVLNTFAGILQKAVGSKTDKQLNVLANQVNKTLGQAYGMKNALMSESILQNNQIPAPIRSIFGDMQELFKTRGAVHKFSKGPSHAGDQILPGGVNYREYLFKYNPNYLREMEPKYSPVHSFGFTDDMAQNTFVHARISDRTDNFGRKLMFVEEIQSDMHQRPQKALRRGEKGVYATRGDKVESVKPLIALLQKTQNKIDKILASDPNDPTLPKLYKERTALSENINDIRGKTSAKSGSSTPEGPFQRSEDYGAFVTKYLLRLAKEGGYDGIAVSTGNIKTRRGYGSEEQKKGHFGFYDKIMNKVLKKIAKNSDVEYITTVINDGNLNWGNVPVLLVKAADKIMKGLPSYKDGGLHRENFVDVVPLL